MEENWQIVIKDKQSGMIYRRCYVRYEDDAKHYARLLGQELGEQYELSVFPPHGGIY